MNLLDAKDMLLPVDQLDGDAAKDLLRRILPELVSIVRMVQAVHAVPSSSSVEFRMDHGELTMITRSPGADLKSESWDFHSQVGGMLTFSLLQKAEGHPWSGLNSFAFCRTDSADQIMKAKTAVGLAMKQQCPVLGLRIESKTRPASPSNNTPAPARRMCWVSWSSEADVINQAEVAASVVGNALLEVRERKAYEKAFCMAVKATASCSLFFPAYSLCLDCLTLRPDLLGRDAIKDSAQLLISRVPDVEQWLRSLRQGFTSGPIPEDLKPWVQELCVQEVNIRLRKISRLRAALCGNGSGVAIAMQNPFNLLVSAVRDGDAGVVSDGMSSWDTKIAQEQRDSIIRRTRDILRDSKKTEAFESRTGMSLPDEIVSDSTVLVAIQEAAHNSDFLFPEPEDNSDSWITETAKLTADRVMKYLYAQESTSSHVSFDEIKDAMADEYNDDGTAKRINHRRSDRTKSSSEEDW